MRYDFLSTFELNTGEGFLFILLLYITLFKSILYPQFDF